MKPTDIRINDLARELEVKAKFILGALPQFGFLEKKTHSSSIPIEAADKVRTYLRALKSSEAVTSKPVPKVLPASLESQLLRLSTQMAGTMASVGKGRGDVYTQVTQVQRCLYEFEELTSAIHEELREIGKRYELLDAKTDRGILPIDSVRLLNYVERIEAMLDKVEKQAKRGEKTSSRIGRLAIPRNVQALMKFINEERNAAVHEQHVCRGAEAKAVRAAWNAIREWARSQKLVSKRDESSHSTATV